MGSGIAYRERATECMRIAESCVDFVRKRYGCDARPKGLGLATQIELDDRDERSSKHDRAKIESN